MTSLRAGIAFLVCSVLAAPLFAQSASLVPLPPPSGYQFYDVASVSPNGATATAQYYSGLSAGEYRYAAFPTTGSAVLFQRPAYVPTNDYNDQYVYCLSDGFAAGQQYYYDASYGSSMHRPVVWRLSDGEVRNLLPIGTPNPGQYRYGFARDVSDDGRVAIGQTATYSGGFHNGYADVKWIDGTPQALVSPNNNSQPLYLADDDANVIAGYGYTPLASSGTIQYVYGPVRWRNDVWEGVTPFQRRTDGYAYAYPQDLSSDGNFIVGQAQRFSGDDYLGQAAVRWDSAGQPLPVGPQQLYNGIYIQEDAQHCSDDGRVVAGSFAKPRATGGTDQRGFRWDESTGAAVDLGTLAPDGSGGYVGFSSVADMSRDGRTIVGNASTNQPGGSAFVWRDGQMRSLWDLCLNEYGLDLTGWTLFHYAYSCSDDGSVIVGYGAYNGQSMNFRVTLPFNQAPTIATGIAATETVKVGETFSATLTGTDPDDDDLSVTSTGLPAGATLTPTTGSSPLTTTLTWAPTPADFGSSHPISIAFADGVAGPVAFEFELNVAPNAVPTIDTVETATLECEGAVTTGTFVASIYDDNYQPLTVTWRVDGEIVSGPTPYAGSQTAFDAELEYDFTHEPGPSETHLVEVEVSDGYDAAFATTEVTIEDSESPFLASAAPDIVVPTDPGVDYAAAPVLEPRPTVVDTCDGDPVLTLVDAPEVYELGANVIWWVATDAAGNDSAPIMQLVIVEDREAPVFGENPPRFTLPVDMGEVVATFAIPEPDVTDNVSVVELTSDAPASGTYPVGETTVTWTAEDFAGNSETFSQIVEVVNQAPVADAGTDVTLEWTSAAGASVTLDGSGSSDADGHDLTYLWSAPGVTLSGATTVSPTGTFPPGTTEVTLTVTDEAGAIGSDTVNVTVVPKYVVDTRSLGPDLDACTANALALCQSLSAANPGNAYLTYASQYAQLASNAHAQAAGVTYFNENDLPGQTGLYKQYRYYQYQYHNYAALYLYYGGYYSPGVNVAPARDACNCAATAGNMDYNQP